MLGSIATELRSRIHLANKDLTLSQSDVANAVLRALLQLICKEIGEKFTQKVLVTTLKKILDKWARLLYDFVKENQENQVALLTTLEEYCLSDEKKIFDSVLPFVLQTIFEAEVIEEDAVWAWEKEADTTIIKKCEKFLTWLKEAEEEGGEEEN